MFAINYILKKPELIVPWGDVEKSLHWFGLTDGLLWIDVGDAVIYEYKEPHPDNFGTQVRYNDYQLTRFLEDFLELSSAISEPVPKLLYDSIDAMEDDFEALKSKYIDTSDDEFDSFYDEFYLPLIEWYYNRCMDSGHLVCGPQIGFFRCDDKLKVVWNSKHMNDGTELWKYPCGSYEMPYSEFVAEVIRFVNNFTSDMDRQVADVFGNGIPGVSVDTDALMHENTWRKDKFINQLKPFYAASIQETDWKRVIALYECMRKELDQL